MADITGKLTPQEIETVAAYFRRVFPHGVECPMCHNKRTEIGQYMLAPMPYGGQGVNLAPPIGLWDVTA